MSSVGWNIRRQVKSYGKFITAELDGDSLRINIADNPLGLKMDESGLPIPGTRDVADRLCYMLNTLLEEVETMQQKKELRVTEPSIDLEASGPCVLPAIRPSELMEEVTSEQRI